MLYNKNVEWESFSDDDNEMIELGMELLEDYLINKDVRPNPDFLRTMFIDEFDGFEDVAGGVKNAIVVKAMERWEQLHLDQVEKQDEPSAMQVLSGASEETADSNILADGGAGDSSCEETFIFDGDEEHRSELYNKNISQADNLEDKVKAAFATFSEIMSCSSWNGNEPEDKIVGTPVEELYSQLDSMFASSGVNENAVRRETTWTGDLYDGGAIAATVTVAWMDEELHQESVYAETAC